MQTTTGLCASCAHQKLIRNTRGSTFSLCELAKTDARFPKYPRLPVLRCEGFSPAAGPGTPGCPDSTATG